MTARICRSGMVLMWRVPEKKGIRKSNDWAQNILFRL
jgi:hypothetical protein